jgi:hypothetical protein
LLVWRTLVVLRKLRGEVPQKKAEYAALIVREKASSSREKASQMHTVLQILENS